MSPRDSGAGDRGGARRMLPSVSEVATELGRQVAADPAVLYKVARQIVAEELAKVKQGLESAPLDTLVKRARRVLAASEAASGTKQPDLFVSGVELSADDKAGRDLSAPFEVAAPPPVPHEIPAPPARPRSEERGLVEVPPAGRRFDRVSAELPAEAVGVPPLPLPAPAPAPVEPAPARTAEPPPPPPSLESYLVKPASPSLIRRIAGDAPAEPVPAPPPLAGGAGPETPALEHISAEPDAPEGHIPSEDEATLSAEFKSFPKETLERLSGASPLAAEVPLAAPEAADPGDATRPVEPAPARRSRSWIVAVLAFAFLAAAVAGGVWWLISQDGRVVKTEAVRVEVPPKPAPQEAAPAAAPTAAPAAPVEPPPAAPKSAPPVKAAPPKAPPAKAAPKPAPAPAPVPGSGHAAVMVTKDWVGKPPVFVLHFSSHKDRPSAEKEAARLAAALFKPGRAVEVDLGNKGVWYRVVIGEFGRVEEARAFREDLVAKNTPGMGFVYEMRGK